MRQKLHQYIDLGDEKLLKIMYVVAKEYNGEYDDSNEYSASHADMQVFEERRQKRLSGESKTYGWEQAKIIITGKKLPDEL
jgi:hypothetical protein